MSPLCFMWSFSIYVCSVLACARCEVPLLSPVTHRAASQPDCASPGRPITPSEAGPAFQSSPLGRGVQGKLGIVSSGHTGHSGAGRGEGRAGHLTAFPRARPIPASLCLQTPSNLFKKKPLLPSVPLLSAAPPSFPSREQPALWSDSRDSRGPRPGPFAASSDPALT